MGFRPRPRLVSRPSPAATPARRLRPGEAVRQGDHHRGRGRNRDRAGATGGRGRHLARAHGSRGGGAHRARGGGRRARPRSRRSEVDFTDLEAVDAAVAALLDAHPDVDLLIAGAGLDRAQSLLAFDWRQAHDDFKVNALSNLVLLSHLVPAMAERGRGHVTAIVSLAGLVGLPYEAAYSGSKAALATIADSARAELEPQGITFTAVFPGFVDTPMFRANAFKQTRERHQPVAAPTAPRWNQLPPDSPRRRRADIRRHPQAPGAARLPRDRIRAYEARGDAPRPDQGSAGPQGDEPAVASLGQRVESRAMTEDLARLDATAQAELVRSGEATPARARRSRYRADRGVERRAQRGHPQALRRGARGGRGRAAGRALQGRAVPAQGPRRGVRRPAAPHGHAGS